jgi:hypothetical protein
MVFTHLPANVCLMLTAFAPTIEIAFALLMVRGFSGRPTSWPSQPGGAARGRKCDRRARSPATALEPLLSGCLLTVSLLGWPLVLAGALKAGYELALLWQFAKVKAAEEVAEARAPAR